MWLGLGVLNFWEGALGVYMTVFFIWDSGNFGKWLSVSGNMNQIHIIFPLKSS